MTRYQFRLYTLYLAMRNASTNEDKARARAAFVTLAAARGLR